MPLVDDDAGDQLLIQNILKSSNSQLVLEHVYDGEETRDLNKLREAIQHLLTFVSKLPLAN